MPLERDFVAHCVKCQETDELALFAHRVEGQMVGWLFVCAKCWPIVTGARLEITLIYPLGSTEIDDAGRDDLLLS